MLCPDLAQHEGFSPSRSDVAMSQTIRRAIVEFLKEEDGPTAVEYAIMLALIGAVCIGSVNFMADRTIESFDSSRIAIEAAN